MSISRQGISGVARRSPRPQPAPRLLSCPPSAKRSHIPGGTGTYGDPRHHLYGLHEEDEGRAPEPSSLVPEAPDSQSRRLGAAPLHPSRQTNSSRLPVPKETHPSSQAIPDDPGPAAAAPGCCQPRQQRGCPHPAPLPRCKSAAALLGSRHRSCHRLLLSNLRA